MKEKKIHLRYMLVFVCYGITLSGTRFMKAPVLFCFVFSSIIRQDKVALLEIKIGLLQRER